VSPRPAGESLMVVRVRTAYLMTFFNRDCPDERPDWPSWRQRRPDPQRDRKTWRRRPREAFFP